MDPTHNADEIISSGNWAPLPPSHLSNDSHVPQQHASSSSIHAQLELLNGRLTLPLATTAMCLCSIFISPYHVALSTSRILLNSSSNMTVVLLTAFKVEYYSFNEGSLLVFERLTSSIYHCCNAVGMANDGPQ